MAWGLRWRFWLTAAPAPLATLLHGAGGIAYSTLILVGLGWLAWRALRPRTKG